MSINENSGSRRKCILSLKLSTSPNSAVEWNGVERAVGSEVRPCARGGRVPSHDEMTGVPERLSGLPKMTV